MQEQYSLFLYSQVENEFLVIKLFFFLVEIKVMGAEWMCLPELNRRIVSILNKLELVFSLA